MISVQLWSVRDALSSLGWDETLRRLAEAGFTNVEPFAIAQTRHLFEDALQRHRLSTPTGHGELVPEQREATIAAARELGIELLMQPMFPAESWQTREGIMSIADDLNTAADAAPEMRIAFHNHDDEVRIQIDGRPALVELFDHVGPRVGVEFDPNWAFLGGADVGDLIRVLREHPGGDRIFALHLKDSPASASANTDQVALGDGDLDWPGFLTAAPGVPRVIGIDMFAGDSLDAVLRSHQWLVDNDPAA